MGSARCWMELEFAGWTDGPLPLEASDTSYKADVVVLGGERLAGLIRVGRPKSLAQASDEPRTDFADVDSVERLSKTRRRRVLAKVAGSSGCDGSSPAG